jgi:hypothetical protein
MSAEEAKTSGYTRRVYCDSDFYSFEALVKPDADLDDTFRCYDVDNGQWLNVNGWMFVTEDMGETA